MMYQNSPHYNQGYAAPTSQNPYGGGGYYGNNDMHNHHPQHPPSYPGGGHQYGAPSPVNAAYQRANAAMAGVPPGRGPSPINGGGSIAGAGGGAAAGGGGASGLIRLTLRKPMGIVFEPMTDPHNPSQQRGVRICDLPRTGAAAMSQKLEVGDELLSINDKTMSRLTFDEIMDFIIVADKERVDLLFRRPGKEKLKGVAGNGGNSVNAGGGPGPPAPLSPMGLAGIGSNSNSVKWIDEKSDMGGKLTEDVREPERDSSRRNAGRGGGGGKVRDDPSVDDTYNDGYTVESQSQYTMETYEYDRGGGRDGGRNGGGDGRFDSYGKDRDPKSKHRSRRNDHGDGRGDREGKGGKDPVESGGFLDLLIDTLCTSVMGRDAREMCGDRRSGGGDSKKGTENIHPKKYQEEDDEFTVDDGTYATYEEQATDDHHRNHNNRHHNRKQEEEETLASEDEGTFTEDDGTRTLQSKDVVSDKKTQQQQQIKDQLKIEKELAKAASKGSMSRSMSKTKSKDMDAIPRTDVMVEEEGDGGGDRQFPSDPKSASFDHISAPDPPTKASASHQQHQHHPQDRHQHQQAAQIGLDHLDEQESEIASGIPLPVRELEYDDRVDYAADVSVMESLGGPSLLVERARHENAASSGADRASSEQHAVPLETRDPELAELVAVHGEGFVPDSGMTVEETAFRDPYKFYEHAVCALLRENEPEKVRLLGKLMAKYRGRERHLINKLSARYNKDKEDVGGGANAGNGGGDEDHAVASSGGADIRTKGSNATESSNQNANNANNQANIKVSAMELIQEGGEEDEEAGSSFLNDPSRANIQAIETAKKKMESSGGEDAGGAAAEQVVNIPKTRSSNDDGWPSWPPAVADPWGTGGAGPEAGVVTDGPRQLNNEEASHPVSQHDDDEGSYSDGSSYSGDESEGVDGTSPAIIAQVSELLNYVYGKTSVAGQIDRVSTIMRAYEGREAVLLELLETKALIKANADSNNRDAADLPMSLRNSPGLNNATTASAGTPQGQQPAGGDGADNEGPANNSNSEKKLTPQTPVSVLTAPTMAEYPGSGGLASPASIASPKEGTLSPSAATLSTLNTLNTTGTGTSKKKKKKMFGGFFGGKKNKGKGNFPASSGEPSASPPSKARSRRIGRKGQPLNEDDRSI